MCADDMYALIRVVAFCVLRGPSFRSACLLLPLQAHGAGTQQTFVVLGHPALAEHQEDSCHQKQQGQRDQGNVHARLG